VQISSFSLAWKCCLANIRQAGRRFLTAALSFVGDARAGYNPNPYFPSFNTAIRLTAKSNHMTFENSSAQQGDLQREVAELIVQALNLDVAPGDIKADEPLYGDGLGLDSIDVLEIALVVSKRYGLQLRADNDDNHRIFSSLASLCDYIARNKAA
jgi:acyl carrier protein